MNQAVARSKPLPSELCIKLKSARTGGVIGGGVCRRKGLGVGSCCQAPAIQATRALAPARVPEILDVGMAAAFLTVSRDTVYHLFQSGQLPGRKVGRK